MRTLMLTFFAVMLLGNTYAQFKPVQTFGAKLQSIYIGNTTDEVILYSLDESSAQLDLYNSDFQKTGNVKLYVPTGSSIGSLIAINEDLADGISGAEYAYTVTDIANNSSVYICDNGGALIKGFSGATTIELIQPGKQPLLVVSGVRNGDAYTDLHGTWNNTLPLLNSFPTGNLSHGILVEKSTDSTDFFFYYLDIANSQLLGYNKEFKLTFSPTLSLPLNSTLAPTVYGLMDKVYNTTAPKEFGVVYEVSSGKSALIFDETGKNLQTLEGVEELEVLLSMKNIVAKTLHEGVTKWDVYFFVEGKNFDNAEFKISLPNAPVTDGVTNICYKDNDSTIMKFASLGINSAEIDNKQVDLALRNNEEITKWSVLHKGNGDGDDKNQEVYFVAKNMAANTSRFNIAQEGQTSILEVKDVIDFEFVEGIFQGTSTRLLLHFEDGSTEVYEYNWEIQPANRITPAHKQDPVNDLEVFFNWNSVTNATDYNVLVITDTADMVNTSVFQSTTSDTFAVSTGLEPSTTYYWLLRVRNANSTKFNVRRFQRFTTLDISTIETPQLLGPMNASKDLAKENATLFWSTAKNATGFEYQVSESIDFDVFTSGSTKDSSAKLVGLAHATDYYWRVRSLNGSYGSQWSTVWSFTTGEMKMITPPTLTSPVNYLANTGTEVSFAWDAVEDVVSYSFEYAPTPSFMNATSTTLNTNAHQVSNLLFSTQYFWRVQVTTTEGTSYWSEVWTFVTTQAPKLGISVLVAPKNNSKDLSPSTVTLRWAGIAEADGYKYQISTDPNFSVMTEGEVTQGQAILTNLEENTTYYWRVKSTKANASGDWSEIWVFTTGAVIDNVNELRNADITVYPNPAHGQLTIRSGATVNLQATLYTMDGRTVWNGTVLPNSSTQIELGNLPIAMYHLSLTSGNGQINQVIIVK